jgi:16S rRNA (cytidine1402-2'-O)-methyltransferase
VSGTLYLLPCPIADAPAQSVLPDGVLSTARGLTYFLAENAKSTRAFLKSIAHPVPLRDLDIVEIGHEPGKDMIEGWLAPIASGRDGALVSEAGCPAIADPGSSIVAAAHARGVPVQPLVGPSALLLALMASGLNGQRFRFLGYLPVSAPERAKRLQALERESRAGETQGFIETPYRSGAMFDAILAACAPGTRVTVAVDLTGSAEYVQTRSVAAWSALGARPPLERRPCVFLLLG